MKLGSLFDGSGGFPLAGALCDIEPVWASEVEPYPIAVTKSRFPNMRHLGDVSKINGATIEPVDIITFGSPCQDLSVAGKQAGLKHEDNGDEETTRSGLFMEAVRIIKEMRGATNGEYPKIALWENVPGAFSSSKGEDFRTVLEELIKIVEPNAVMPGVPKKGWAHADYYRGNGWSIAYRVLDAQYIRTAQRRKRIYLVLCLTNERAREILFERQSLRGYLTQSGTQRQGITSDAQGSIGTDDIARTKAIGFDTYNMMVVGDKTVTLRAGSEYNYAPVFVEVDDSERICYGFPLGFRPENVRCYEETATTLCNGTRAGFCNGVVVGYDGYNADVTGNKAATLGVNCGMSTGRNGVVVGVDIYNQALTGDKTKTLNSAATDSDHVPCVVYSIENHPNDSRVRIDDEGKVQALTGRMGTGGGNVPMVMQPFCKSRRAQTSDDATTWKYAEVANTLNNFDTGEARANELVVYAMDRASFNQGENAQYDFEITDSGVNSTIVAKGLSAVCLETFHLTTEDDKTQTLKARDYKDPLTVVFGDKPHYIVRRLTPTECARLQGFPDVWGHIEPKSDLTDEEYAFWLEVRNTHANINSKAVKDYTKTQMLAWYNKLWTDSAEYKMWGNGIALPCALYVMQGIADVLNPSNREENEK